MDVTSGRMSWLPAAALLAACALAPMDGAAQAPAPANSAVGELLARGGIQPTPQNVAPTDEKQTFVVIDKLENTVPLPQELRDLRDRLPPDPPSVMRALGLPVRQPVETDLRDTPTPSVDEIKRALQKR